eukprot:jgi/Psemu1/8448/gm1.8448_g
MNKFTRQYHQSLEQAKSQQNKANMKKHDYQEEEHSQVKLIRQKFETSKAKSQHGDMQNQSYISKWRTNRFSSDNAGKTGSSVGSMKRNRRSHQTGRGNIDISSSTRSKSRLEILWNDRSKYSNTEPIKDSERLKYNDLSPSWTVETEMMDWAELSSSPESDQEHVFSFSDNDTRVVIDLGAATANEIYLNKRENETQSNNFGEIFQPNPREQNETIPISSQKLQNHVEMLKSNQALTTDPLLELQIPAKSSDIKEPIRSMNTNTGDDDDDHHHDHDHDDVSNDQVRIKNNRDAWNDPYFDNNVIDSNTGMFLKLSSNFETRKGKECAACTIM